MNIKQAHEKAVGIMDMHSLRDDRVKAIRDALLEKSDHFAWLVEVPGQRYLAARKLGGYEFHWTADHNEALRFCSQEQADLVLMTVREMRRDLFAFAVLLGEARPVEHGWMTGAPDER
jgi:hypothetical protein